METIYIIGGAAIDITGKPDSICRERDSNLGRVCVSASAASGTISQSGSPRWTIMSSWSPQSVPAFTRAWCARAAKKQTFPSRTPMWVPNTRERISAYLTRTAICSSASAICPCSTISRRTTWPRFCRRSTPRALCVIDGNLSPESLAYLCASVTVPLFYDPVSCAKAKRIGDQHRQMLRHQTQPV